MVAFPHCKINLGLHVIAKREDGYHSIETCFYPVPWTDILEIIPSSEFSFTTSGAEITGREEDNLCIKAYKLLKENFNIGNVKIHLHKVLPMGAGLGGGSSDAAYTLRVLNTLFKLQLSVLQLRGYAAQLGSDCSFFIEDKPMIGSGRGEILSPAGISLKGYYLVLVKPDIHVSTAEAYAGVKPKAPAHPVTDLLKLAPAEWKSMLKNDFEDSVFARYPGIEVIKKELYRQGALYASMSGSGSSVFGIFNSPVNIAKQFEGMHSWSGPLT
jgi:4-diphosphocytidyl-2-C-methyl-D-erythritol kinase